MSFTNDTRPDTRKYVVASWILRIAPLLALALLTVPQLFISYDVYWDSPWSDVVSYFAFLAFLGLIASFFVDRAKKNADARWALRESDRMARLTAEAKRN